MGAVARRGRGRAGRRCFFRTSVCKLRVMVNYRDHGRFCTVHLHSVLRPRGGFPERRTMASQARRVNAEAHIENGPKGKTAIAPGRVPMGLWEVTRRTAVGRYRLWPLSCRLGRLLMVGRPPGYRSRADYSGQPLAWRSSHCRQGAFAQTFWEEREYRAPTVIGGAPLLDLAPLPCPHVEGRSEGGRAAPES